MSPIPADQAPLKRALAREEVYRTLKTWIIEGTLAPRENIRDQELALKLGVSRTPIREALRRLEDEGLIETAKNRWTRVAPLNLKNSQHTYPIIAHLEDLALQLAFLNLTEADLQKMDEANQRFQEALSVKDSRTALQADETFHGVLLERSGNPELRKIVTELKTRLMRLEWYYYRTQGSSAPSVTEHHHLLDALKTPDLAEARTALAANWTSSVARLMNLPEP
ncbi:GntR family transcriptional regulator [Deinococcus cellulosilyticus]|uniref:Putative transcriptional regulator, GntR family protein n=1 Tax=Deinococcus cellulosilyticus (strain DSM 18568 / NBRC 106333 / KACC 11606 / 5516J-15) TaxID=1223518 RepID=A0A511N4F5_DEIC1|nr:GntR family transcriptional regulator [Deinococcus cellulosilyticus]GEM47261.1 putative transcriptional regulator, GntR family protein [Deinococcus cellulosilyticus NBRC 106333 = KACC 11606]